jgi:hypothetical protein
LAIDDQAAGQEAYLLFQLSDLVIVTALPSNSLKRFTPPVANLSAAAAVE